MARPNWPRDARDLGPFHANLKCCTFEPFLPNFTLGRMLSEGTLIGTHDARLADAIRKGCLTPLGLLPASDPSSFGTSEGTSEKPDFGRNLSARCSFLGERAQCTIWMHRPSVCRSYFCVSDLGPAGQAQWKAAEEKGNELEWRLANEVAWDLGFTQDEIENGEWAEWRGREFEFFKKCSERALSELFNLSPDV
jgi:Fe-S-cluster containining protein